MVEKDFIVAIELGSSKVTGIAGKKKPDGSISVLALAKEDSSSFIRKGVVYNIDKTAQCLTSIVKKLEGQLKMRISQVYVGVGGQSIHSVLNVLGRDLPADTIITADMVAELMDENANIDLPDMKFLDLAEQEYRVDSQLQLDPVGIRATRLEGNFLNILERKAFFQNLEKCFETAGIKTADMYLAPLALAQAVLTESEMRSGCVLVDLGYDTTTVSVFFKNVLRHMAVIPLGANNITKDIATLQMEDADAEKMKLKYAQAYTDNADIDENLRYAIDADRSVTSRDFIAIVESRLEEIIANVARQIPAEYKDKLLCGVVLTGGGANMKNIEKAFTTYAHFEKVRVAKFVTATINSGHEPIKAHNAMMNTVLGLLMKGDMNCAGGELNPNGSLFDKPDEQQPPQTQRGPRGVTEKGPGVVRTEREEQQAQEEAARKKREEEEAARKAEEEKRRKEEEERKKNSWWNRAKNKISNFGQSIVSEE